MLYNGGIWLPWSMCYVILIGEFFSMIHSIGPINVCTDFEINRYKIDEFRKHANIVCFIWRHVMQKWRCILLIGITIRNILKTTRSLHDFRFKGYTSNNGFHVFDDLDLWPMFYFCHTHWAQALGWCMEMYWISMRRFIWPHMNPSSINGWYGHGHTHKHTPTHRHTYTPKVILIVSQIPSGSTKYIWNWLLC